MSVGNFKNALFICNEKFLDPAIPGGGVKFCTDEYISLIKTGFNIFEFPVRYRYSFLRKIKRKLNLHGYEDYFINDYSKQLKSFLAEKNIDYVFLNLTNTAAFAKLIKSISASIKVILCSHGNESGDYLHDISKHEKYLGYKKTTAIYNLGNMLLQEAEFRKYIDLVLTVSDVEEGIEKWLGAKAVYMVPRFIEKNKNIYEPIEGKVGFISDLSHEPNYFGMQQLCKALSTQDYKNLQVVLVGGGEERGKELENKYAFVKYLGYLAEQNLAEETASWTFALNPVFYFSRGVSTKLGKTLGMGYPVITTKIGMRGYEWTDGKLPMVENPHQMAKEILHLAFSKDQWYFYHNEVFKIQQSSVSYQSMMSNIMKLLN